LLAIVHSSSFFSATHISRLRCTIWVRCTICEKVSL